MKTTFKQLTLNLDLGLLLPFLFPPPSPAEEGDPQGNHGHHHDYHHTHLVDIIQFVRILWKSQTKSWITTKNNVRLVFIDESESGRSISCLFLFSQQNSFLPCHRFSEMTNQVYKQTILFLVVWKLLELTIKNFLGKLWFGGKSRKLFRWFCSHTELNFSRFLESRQYVFDFGPHLTSYPTTDCGWPLPPPYGPKP